MKPVSRFEHFVKYCEFLEPQTFAFHCFYDLAVDVSASDEAEHDASWYWKHKMNRNVHVSALLKREFDHIKETHGTGLSGDWPTEQAGREKALAQLLSAAFERDIANKGLRVHSFEIRVAITEMIDEL